MMRLMKEIAAQIEVMRAALENEKGVQYADFWEARRICLPLFKESIHPAIRARLWSEFRELSEQARKLKGMRDQESRFALEQFEKAIAGIEEDLESPAVLAQQPAVGEEYAEPQRQLGLLSLLGRRMTALRRELLETDLRAGDKNRLLRQLSSLGDQIFPKRKEIAAKAQVSFAADVETYLQRHFGKRELQGSLRKLKDEIRELQAVASRLGLALELRPKLNEAWERVAAAEQQWREERQAEDEERQADAAVAKQHRKLEAKLAVLIENSRSLLDIEDPEELERSYAAVRNQIGSHPNAEALCEQIEDRLIDLQGGDLARRLEQLTQVRAALETWEKRANASGLDLQGALEAHQRVAQQRARLERVEEAIAHLEE